MVCAGQGVEAPGEVLVSGLLLAAGLSVNAGLMLGPARKEVSQMVKHRVIKTLNASKNSRQDTQNEIQRYMQSSSCGVRWPPKT